MGLYDGIKDVAKVLQQADNVDLYMKLLDLSSQALDMQQEIEKLRSENNRLTDIAELEKVIIRNPKITIVTRTDEETKIFYCSHCWDYERKLIQVILRSEGQFNCPHEKCGNNGVYDEAMKEANIKNVSNSLPTAKFIPL